MRKKELRDLKKGDIVYYSIYGSESKEVKVKKVKIVDKAVLVTIEPAKPMHYGVFFTGYYTGDTAIGMDNGIIMTHNGYLEELKDMLHETREKDSNKYSVGKALKALIDIKAFLFRKDKNIDFMNSLIG